MDKTQALKSNQGNFDSIMALSSEAVADLQWWINSVEETSKPVKQRETQISMTNDASKKGWGCSVEGTSTVGSWTHHEAQYDINYLETKAVFLALQAFSHEVSRKYVSILVDNTTAVSCINQMRTCHSKEINSIVRQIWEWCISCSIRITVSHIPGKEGNKEGKLNGLLILRSLTTCLQVFQSNLILIYLHHGLITNAKICLLST